MMSDWNVQFLTDGDLPLYYVESSVDEWWKSFGLKVLNLLIHFNKKWRQYCNFCENQKKLAYLRVNTFEEMITVFFWIYCDF